MLLSLLGLPIGAHRLCPKPQAVQARVMETEAWNSRLRWPLTVDLNLQSGKHPTNLWLPEAE